MAVTLGHIHESVTLPDDMRWINEYTAKRMQTNMKRALSGIQIIEQANLISGIDVTLQGGVDYGWCTREQVERLDYIRQLPAQNYPPIELNYKGRTRYVLFKDEGLVAEPVIWYDDPEPTDMFIVTLYLVTILPQEKPNNTFFSGINPVAC